MGNLARTKVLSLTSHLKDGTLSRAVPQSMLWGVVVPLDQREECPLLAFDIQGLIKANHA